MKTPIIIAAIIVAAASVFYWKNTEEPIAQNSPSPSASTVENEGGESFHDVSIPALIQKEYNGSDFTVGRVLAQAANYTRYFITYKSEGLTISGIMNVPRGNGPFPVIFTNHGYIDPAVYTNGRGLRREQEYLAQRGYVVIHPDYRNHAQSSKDPNADVQFRLGYVADVINGVKAIQNSGLPYINKEKIGMLGHSMGGGVTLNTLVIQPDLVDAAVLFAPVSIDQRDNFERWTRSRPATADKIIELYGSYATNPRFWDDISAINFIERITTPIMNHHGTADDSVPIQWSEDLQKALEEADKDATLHIYPGEPHEFAQAWTQVMQRTVAFFDEHLK